MNIPLNIDWQQILLHLLNFVILAAGLSLLLFSPVKRFMEKRRAHFEALEKSGAEKEKLAAEHEREYAAKLLKADDEIRQMRKDEAARLAELADRQLEEAREKAASIIEDAKKEAEVKRERILADSRNDIAGLVVTAAEKLLFENQNEATDKALYDRFLALTEEEADGK